jgi:hypothetical protein
VHDPSIVYSRFTPVPEDPFRWSGLSDSLAVGGPAVLRDTPVAQQLGQR